MRVQLLTAGVLIALLGGALFVLDISLNFLLAYYWSLVFLAGGTLMALAGLFASPGSGPVAPPDGYRFCKFCSAPVPSDVVRCPQCNGVQSEAG